MVFFDRQNHGLSDGDETFDCIETLSRQGLDLFFGEKIHLPMLVDKVMGVICGRKWTCTSEVGYHLFQVFLLPVPDYQLVLSLGYESRKLRCGDERIRLV